MWKKAVKRVLRYPYGSFVFDVKPLFHSMADRVSIRRRGREVMRSFERVGKAPTFMDIGAAGGLQGFWQYFYDTKRIDVVAFDLNDEWGPEGSVTVRKFALGNADEEHDFFITRHPGCSSCREPDPEVVAQFSRKYWFDVVERRCVRLNRFETLVDKGECTVPDFVKIDTQGFECECLEGFGRYLPEVLGIEMEVNFKAMYKGQKVFADVCRFMTDAGFVLRHLEPQWFDRFELVEANAFFSRRPRNDREATLLRFWECNSGLWHAVVEAETPESEQKRVAAIPHLRSSR